MVLRVWVDKLTVSITEQDTLVQLVLVLGLLVYLKVCVWRVEQVAIV
jgi:hypothetical protein